MSASIDNLKQQLQQLADLARSGTLPDEPYQVAKAKLERQLLDAVLVGGEGTSAIAQSPPAQVSRKLIWGMLAFVIAVGAGAYALVGTPDAWHVGPGASSSEPAAKASGAQHDMTPDQINAMVSGLAAKLQADPNNAEGWAMLARTYAALGRFEEALPAYQKAAALRPDDAAIYADYADAMGVTRGRKLDGEPTALIAKALKLDPHNFKALFLSGTIAFEHQDFKGAADLWERAGQYAPSDNPELSKQIRAALDDARQRAGLPPQAANAASNAAPTSDSKAEVSGVVTLSKALAGQVSPDDAVFIFARAAQGPKMPLAVLRKQVKDLPATFTLSDALAMSPQMKLSSFTDVVVGARVSKSGQAMPQPGDWQGLSAPIKVGASHIQIDISEPVR